MLWNKAEEVDWGGIKHCVLLLTHPPNEETEAWEQCHQGHTVLGLQWLQSSPITLMAHAHRIWAAHS